MKEAVQVSLSEIAAAPYSSVSYKSANLLFKPMFFQSCDGRFFGTQKHADSDVELMQNSMFIRKIFNKHFVFYFFFFFFFLQRNCTSVKVLQNAAELWGVK